MKKEICKRLIAFSLIISLSLSVIAYADTDIKIFNDPVQNTYTGRQEAKELISNLNFTDIAPDFWAKEAIVRTGTLNLVKGYDKIYKPNSPVTNEEALAFVLRAIGEEQTAQTAAVNQRTQLPDNSPLRTLWSIGYLFRSMQLGLITNDDYSDALIPDQAQLNPQYSFIRGADATRERVADWLVKGLENANPNAFVTNSSQQSIYPYSDWSDLDVRYVSSMEKALRTGIFKGNADGKLNPKGKITRAEMAQVLRNMDSIYYNMNGITRKNGTVGGIKDSQSTTTGSASLTRDLYIRTSDGKIDLLKYTLESNSSPQAQNLDAVVLKSGLVQPISALAEGDEIEYLVNNQARTLIYVNVTSNNLVTKEVQGYLKSVNLDNSTITIADPTGKEYSYPIVEGIHGSNADGSGYLILSEKKRLKNELPIGSIVELSLKNNVTAKITFIGEPALVDEARGIVTENDPDMGILSFIDNSGNIVTKNYLSGDMKVKKLKHFQRDDDIGYITELFPNYKFNPLEASIEEVEPGDIVFMRFDPNDRDTIINISASTNYIAKYGKIKEIVDNGDYHSIVFEYENKQVSWFDIADDVFVIKEGKPIKLFDVQEGDWAKLLINQAIAEPGVILESVKEMTVEGGSHFITTVVKGQITGLNAIQRQLQLRNSQKLGNNGWEDYRNLEKLSLSGKDIEYYQDGKKISLDYAMQYLKRADGEVYVALEDNYSGQKIKKVTFRNGRDEWLKPDSVLDADGNGGFKTLSNEGYIQTDSGTIVIKNGRLVSGGNIGSSDYVSVSLNGGNQAAVVTINDVPDTSGVTIVRGRVIAVDSGKTFKVKSISLLSGTDWIYTPVEREFTIDYNTKFYNDTGLTTALNFTDYGEENALNKAYTVVVTGSHADRVYVAPYAQFTIRGKIYDNTGDTVKLREVQYYDNETGNWKIISETNNTLTATLHPNTIIDKNNKTVTPAELKNNEQIRIMTTKLPDPKTPGAAFDAYIINVEK